jgi:mono/diheme cytochrome c family protein
LQKSDAAKRRRTGYHYNIRVPAFDPETVFMKITHWCAIPFLLLAALPLRAGDPAKPPAAVGYNRDVRPILSNRCFKCHGPDLKKGGLDLQTRETALKPLKTVGSAIVPGNCDDSRMLDKVQATDPSQRMPPKGDPLTPEQIATLKVWIEQGAKYEQHWAYIKPSRPELPTVKNKDWVRNGIDVLVLARLEQEGLAPSPEADRATLMRRASLDLTGLPPTLVDVDAFISDKSPDAYEKMIDRLLASPHYGEHQARFWLDQARYADTNGYEKDERRTIWPYRDWVINAFNHDMPFDQFTIEQIAGDLLPDATKEQKIATGFHRNTMVNTEGGIDDEEFRVAAIVDRVNTTLDVWMGTTIACAQCHNHKFDPFTQKEFYQLFAIFNNTEDRGGSTEPMLKLPTPEQEARIKALKAQTAEWQNVPLAAREALGITGHRGLQEGVATLQKKEAAIQMPSTMVLRELLQPRKTQVMIRGNHKNLGDAVTAGVPARLHPLPAGGPVNRLGLAKWLVDTNNPLTARVTVNRIWARYFGKGFVETSEEFGAQGEPPTHPDLLDFLAVEFMERKWSMKAVHKLIVTSATYRQSSKVSPELHKRDPFNRLCARGPRLRLEAEMVRDNALAISGLLDRKQGGPSVFPYQPDGIWFNPYSGDKWVLSTNGDQYRRGLYTFWRRTAPYAAFMAFDAPSREVACERRPRTNTPLQALAVLNDRAFVEASAALARRMMTATQGDKERIIHGFRRCVARTPTDREIDVLLTLYNENLEKYQKDPAAAKAMAKGGLSDMPKGLDAAELAAWTVIANVLLNLDETITKG